MRAVWRSLFTSRRNCLLLVVGAFILSRAVYYWRGLRIDTGPLLNFWQIIDPVLLRDHPWQSLLYSRSQMPGFNSYLALVMWVFPRHSEMVYQITFLFLGLSLAVCLFLVLDRLHISRPISVLLAVVSVISPVTALYENWLFYEYPIAALFCAAALFLNRYAKNGFRTDGILFFSSLLGLALLRVIYHLFWFWSIVAITIYVLPKWRRRTAMCAIVPGVILSALYLKSVVLFGLWVPGSDVLGSIDLSSFTSDHVSKQTLSRMASDGVISPVFMYVHQNKLEDPELINLVNVQLDTGIPILDNRLKSTGKINMDSLFMAAVGHRVRRDALIILHSHPAATLVSVRRNVQRYFLPADLGWPFDLSQRPNQKVMESFRRYYDLVTTGYHPLIATRHQFAFIAYITIPLTLWYGLWRSIRWLKRTVRKPWGNPTDLTVVFAFVNIVYLSGVIIFFDYTDQNRMVFEVFPLYLILLGMLITFLPNARRMRRVRSECHDFGNADLSEFRASAAHSPAGLRDQCEELGEAKKLLIGSSPFPDNGRPIKAIVTARPAMLIFRRG
jgi:hypothetical protein